MLRYQREYHHRAPWMAGRWWWLLGNGTCKCKVVGRWPTQGNKLCLVASFKQKKCD